MVYEQWSVIIVFSHQPIREEKQTADIGDYFFPPCTQLNLPKLLPFKMKMYYPFSNDTH